MSEVRSTFRLHIGDTAPDFTLPNAEGVHITLADVSGSAGTLVVFACNHCPYVIHLAKPLQQLVNDVSPLGVNCVAINSNDSEKYPQDAPALMKSFAAEHHWDFPYLVDASQEIALAYGAACTPDFFLLDATGKLYYTGQFDDSRPMNGQIPNGQDLRDAITRMLAGHPAPSRPIPSSGCNIKWKPDHQPVWWASGSATQ